MKDSHSIGVVEKVKDFVVVTCPPFDVSRFLLQLRMMYTTIGVPTQRSKARSSIAPRSSALLSCCIVECATRSAQRAVEDVGLAFTGGYICLLSHLTCRHPIHSGPIPRDSSKRLRRCLRRECKNVLVAARLRSIFSEPWRLCQST